MENAAWRYELIVIVPGKSRHIFLHLFISIANPYRRRPYVCRATYLKLLNYVQQTICTFFDILLPSWQREWDLIRWKQSTRSRHFERIYQLHKKMWCFYTEENCFFVENAPGRKPLKTAAKEALSTIEIYFSCKSKSLFKWTYIFLTHALPWNLAVAACC